MKNKRILLVVWDKLDTLGGVQTYNKLLIQIIENNFKNIDIDILLTSNSYKDINDYDKYNNE